MPGCTSVRSRPRPAFYYYFLAGQRNTISFFVFLALTSTVLLNFDEGSGSGGILFIVPNPTRDYGVKVVIRGGVSGGDPRSW